MHKKLFFSAILLTALALPHSLFAHDFSAVAPSGQTLYYDIDSSGGVSVTCPITSHPYLSGYSQPTGALTIPNTVTHDGRTYSVTSIGNLAFSDCTKLTSVTIPSSVTSIGYRAFSNCTGLTSITIPSSVTSIGRQSFFGCTGLTSVTIPGSVTSFGECAFQYCTKLTSITIPSSVTRIGSKAFDHCTSLTSVTIPSSVTSIGKNAFLNVKHIEYHGRATGSPWGAKSMN